ncbi:hypothetical protein D3C81_1142720 [compost metagenome]
MHERLLGACFHRLGIYVSNFLGKCRIRIIVEFDEVRKKLMTAQVARIFIRDEQIAIQIKVGPCQHISNPLRIRIILDSIQKLGEPCQIFVA